MNNHKKIGLIGGVGPQATDFIYNKIIELSQKKYGAKNNADYPYLIIESVPVPDFISNNNNITTAKNMLINSIAVFDKAGVTKIAIASNTVHILLPELQLTTKIKFLSIVDL